VHHACSVITMSHAEVMPELMNCFLLCSFYQEIVVSREAVEFLSEEVQRNYRYSAFNVRLPENEVESLRIEINVGNSQDICMGFFAGLKGLEKNIGDILFTVRRERFLGNCYRVPDNYRTSKHPV